MSPLKMGRDLAIACLATVLPVACSGASASEERLTPVQAKEAAAERAQTHLPFFLERLAAKDAADGDFRLTIRLPAEGRQRPRAELGIKDIVLHGSSFHGVIDRPDKNWPDFEPGETMSFPASIIADWSFTHKGTLVGLFQLRAELCSAPKAAGGERQDQLLAEAAKLGELPFNPKDACKSFDPRKDFAAIEKRK